ncbi:MAG TPA: TolC family protein, partial [Pseudorhodoplanes sp.]|nr:TolC family protein [Pseudorhodoplanes sp.]
MLRKSWGLWAVASVALATTAIPAFGDSIERALVQAYQNNPQVNAQRAALRATDENVPQALSGYRPRISATGSYGALYNDSTSLSTTAGRTTPSRSMGWVDPKTVGGTLTQTLYNGFQTGNRTRQAEAQVFAARETLRVIEQTVLLDAVTSYMNLLRDNAILDLQKRNVEVIQEQLRQTRDRFNVGEVTRTDVAQAESRVAAAQSQMLAAQANQNTSRAAYRRVIGVEAGRLSPGT